MTDDHYVYCAIGSSGEALYVGVTIDVERRLDQHRRRSSWYGAMVKCNRIGPMSKADALWIERKITICVTPRFNSLHPVGRGPDPLRQYHRRLDRKETRQIGQLFGVTRQRVCQILKEKS